MSIPNPPNKFKKGEPRPAGAGRRPGGVNHLTTARVKTESGTTGRPKGAMLTHGVLAAASYAYAAEVDPIAPGDALLHAAPMSHGSGVYMMATVARLGIRLNCQSRRMD